ncbi:hypothetical protein B0H19DRAFT_1155692 [Mycena capillaripes]|nr:hypothetical protein B0H19DRAFT_1155692 [Mycena capillaripes]
MDGTISQKTGKKRFVAQKRSVSATASGHSRVRNEFTEPEEQDLVEFLADYEPSVRLSIHTYRKVAEQPWGSNHSAYSWLSRYKRFQPIYDARIRGLVLENALAESERIDESDVATAKKKPRLHYQRASTSASDDAATFGDLPIPFDRFMKKANLLSERDQFVSLNVAINFLSQVHGVDPEVVYETWELTGDLTLTDEHLREQGEDDEEMPSPQSRSATPDSGSHGSGPAPSSRGKRKRSSSPECPGREADPFASTVPPRKRAYGRARRSEIVGVPSSQPGEADASYVAAPPKNVPPRRDQPPKVVQESPETSALSSPVSETGPPVASDESESESEDDAGSRSSSPVQQPQSPAQRPDPQPDNNTEKSSEDEESESASELEVENALSSPAQSPRAELNGNASDDSDSESDSAASETQPRPLPTNNPAADDDSASESESESESEAEAEAEVACPQFHPTQKSSQRPSSASSTRSGASAESVSSESESEGDAEDAPHVAQSIRKSSRRLSSASFTRSSASAKSMSSRSASVSEEEESYIATQASLFG